MQSCSTTYWHSPEPTILGLLLDLSVAFTKAGAVEAASIVAVLFCKNCLLFDFLMVALYQNASLNLWFRVSVNSCKFVVQIYELVYPPKRNSLAGDLF